MGGLGEDAFSLSSLSSSSPSSSSSPLRAVIPYAVESSYRSIPRRPVVPSDRYRRRRRRGPRSPSTSPQARSKPVSGVKQRRILTGARDFLLFGVDGGSSDVDVVVDGELNNTRGGRKRAPLRASGRTLGAPVSDQEQEERREHRSKRRRRRRWWRRTR